MEYSKRVLLWTPQAREDYKREQAYAHVLRDMGDADNPYVVAASLRAVADEYEPANHDGGSSADE